MSKAPDHPRFTIVLCTRNPKPAYLEKVLAAIGDQTVAVAEREIVVVDSCSQPPLSDRNISWPPGTRIERLDQPGVGRARIAGVQAAIGEWIVFVDDDNVLDANYLEQANEIIRRRPDVALFCGRISGEFDASPPRWLRDFHRQLAIIEFSEDSWARRWDPAKIPCWTAGMCVRSDVVRAHCEEALADPFVVALARAEDVHLVMRAVANGYTAGLFRALHLKHLISVDRMTPEYLCRICRETGFNMAVLNSRERRLSWRDFLRPIKNGLVATLKHGWTPRGRVARAAAAGDFLGAVHCLVKKPVGGPSHG
jgi:glycosyltransferase involved in cell wall biosynthesis